MREPFDDRFESGKGYDDYKNDSEKFDLANGDYQFVIYDDYGDGMTVGQEARQIGRPRY